ncbi:twin-arginine translocation signal domain-containing protein [Pseudoalteromonas sp. T1lg75]|uniref:twin-arginine translocation signal domain-containing protein n=1 Tax=Pseudoalteromonas sp. T1lg75 TaxID=2077102 RepID=UPI001F25F25B|nr:twin-arginine translocation signal domain-containing protein [Pseudoalteromonas sp. T1lg75]
MTIDRRNFLKSAAAFTAATVVAGCAKGQQSENTQQPILAAQGKSVMGLAVPAMDVVRVGFIGVGQRGSGHVKHLCHIMVLK